MVAHASCFTPVSLCRFFFHVIEDVLNRADLFGLFVRDFRIESFLERHHQFHDVEGIGSQIVDYICARRSPFPCRLRVGWQ